MIGCCRIVAVVPAWNEAPRIANVIRTMPHSVDFIVVVDDGSTDGTAETAQAVGDRRVRLVKHARNMGVGAAIVSGYAEAMTLAFDPNDAFVVLAGDGQMDPADIPALVAPIDQGVADYVKGNRFALTETKSVMPKSRWIAGHALSRLTSLAIGRPVSDSQCGYTAISRRACTQIDLDRIWTGYGYPNDLLAHVALAGLRIGEVPVRAVYGDEVSRLRPRHVPKIAALIARAALRRGMLSSVRPRATVE
jgi:dolichol-phosphate mannosyltransferase